MNATKNKWSTNKIKLYLDICIFLFFLVVSAPQATGIALHEWLSFAFLATFIVHLLLNWKWIVKLIRRFFKKLPGETRFNAIWNALLFILGTVVFFSGVFVSEAALPWLGFPIEIDPFWGQIHDLTANLFLILLGVHLAMHWRWFVDAFKRYILRKPAPQKPVTAQGEN